MLNSVVLVGRVTKKPELVNDIITNKKYITLTLAVPRNYKNTDTNMYETDFIPVICFSNIAENVSDFVNEQDLIGIRGRIEKTTAIEELRIIADKVTFLSSKGGK